ncbi:acetate--CoA ligase (ADP-forming) [Natronomonas moolapensis 8.8.11]|uniref:acetate--CoA ligase (ADP-forming) n=1 Tax=Natronomonas moolapensis (strain DSM 18674 / CECT 7526 / JCM 14361 / 8.8.11) TaxID=268739 RepID=M1XRV3_NATM8|nr:acetate--CoA ligase [Natronomonas moolapensis]CCQ36968.1 acetate--CoA ligase (ADP-forming) [Natronomonas moolapensis 8.8.11]
MVRVPGVFDAERVAVVGATEREGSVGAAVMENLLEDFGGEIRPVNPGADRVFGLPCVDDIAETDADLAVIVVPPTVALDVVESAGQAGIENLVVITAGFGEAGGEGATRERKLQELAETYDLNLVGPNCLGVVSTPSGLNATFGPRNALSGRMSFMSQSGALVTAILEWAGDRGHGFKDVVSLGNKAVLDETDFVETWGEDPDTDVVLGYLEGIENGTEFVETAREVTRETPVVVLKSGRTEAGAQAASSHTGAIAGSEAAYEAGLEKAGVIRADSTEELFDFGAMLAGGRLPTADGVAVVTNAGGPGVIATDAIGDSELELATFEDETRRTLQESLPPTANVYNPVDVIGDAPAERFGDALDVVLSDPGVGAAVVIACPSAVLSFDRLAQTLVEARKREDVPIAVCLMGGASVEGPSETLSDVETPTYFDPTRAVRSLAALERYRTIRKRRYEPPASFDVDRDAARSVLERVKSQGDNRLGIEAMELLDAYGIQTPEGDIVDSPGEAKELAERIGGDVVMKVVSPDILHKTDIGGVEVGVPLRDVEDTYEALVSRARNYRPDARLLGVQVQELIDLDDSVETIVGMNRDPQFGPLVLFGLGGVFVEVLEDTTVRIAPLSEAEAAGMLEDIDSTPLLRGARGREPVDEAGIVETIQRLSQLVVDFPAIVELDINPLVATADGVVAVDIRLTVDHETL